MKYLLYLILISLLNSCITIKSETGGAKKNESKEIQRDSLILNSIKLKRLIFNLLSYYCDMIRWDLYQILDPKNNSIYFSCVIYLL